MGRWILLALALSIGGCVTVVENPPTSDQDSGAPQFDARALDSGKVTAANACDVCWSKWVGTGCCTVTASSNGYATCSGPSSVQTASGECTAK